MPGADLTQAHRADLEQLTGIADRDLYLIWQQFQGLDAAAVRDGLRDILPRLVATYGAAAATLAADFYDELRFGEGIAGSFTAIPAELPDVGRTDALAGWGSGPLWSATPDYASALVLVGGGLQNIIANADRMTVTQSAVADPKAEGWQRVGRGACDFCRVLVSRGAVYTEATASFASHDHCRCSSIVAWKGRPRPVEPYTQTDRNITPADRARTRAYLKANPQAG